MIKEVNGDILFSKAKVIAHGVAPKDHFDTGLALSLRENFPAMVKDFRHYCHAHNPKPGEIWTWGGIGGIQIVNLMVQEPASQSKGGHPGKASLSHIEHALKALTKFLKSEKAESIAIPKLATGVGGLDWKDVKDIITKHMGELEIPVYIYATFTKGKIAAEE